MRTLCLLVVGMVLTACSPVNSFVNLQTAQAIQDAQAANDNLIVGVSAAVCAVPVGAVIRNPSFVPVVAAACMPGGQAANSATLLQNMKTNTGIPVYQQTMNAINAAAAPAVAVNSPAPVVQGPLTVVPKTSSAAIHKSHVGVPVQKPPVANVQPAVTTVPLAQPILRQPAQSTSSLPGGALP